MSCTSRLIISLSLCTLLSIVILVVSGDTGTTTMKLTISKLTKLYKRRNSLSSVTRGRIFLFLRVLNFLNPYGLNFKPLNKVIEKGHKT